jgi:hypothetical protein
MAFGQRLVRSAQAAGIGQGGTSQPMVGGGWRKIRVMIVVTLVMATFQFMFGEIGSFTASYPATVGGSIFGYLSALMSASPVLAIHALWGILLFIAAIGTTVLSYKAHKRSVTTSSLLGLVSTIIAVLGGYLWVSSAFTNGGGILLMVNGAIGLYAFYFIALYYTK